MSACWPFVMKVLLPLITYSPPVLLARVFTVCRSEPVPGSVIATLGLIAPSVIIILVIAAFLKAFQDNHYVQGVFRYLRPASVGLITAAGLSVTQISLLNEGQPFGLSLFNWRALILVAVLLVFTRGVKKTKKWHPIIWIGLSAAAGIAFF